MDFASWCPLCRTVKRRAYELEARKAAVVRTQATQHPLQGKKLASVNPLISHSETGLTDEIEDKPQAFWKELMRVIVSRFSSSGSFKIKADAEDVDELNAGRPFSRLDQLEKGKKANELTYLSHQEFIDHMKLVTREMERAWESTDRVKALKVAIQGTKMTRDVVEQNFYPAIFISVTEMLDSFGSLVYARLYNLAFGDQKREAFSVEEVNQNARDTATNWFLKTCCIRELMPRLYIEIALMKSYKIVSPEKFSEIFRRLAEQIRGIGKPVMACYAGMYLAKKAFEILPKEKGYLEILAKDLFAVISDSTIQEATLCGPALSWIVFCLGFNSEGDIVGNIVESHLDSAMSHSTMLRALLESLPEEQILSRVDQFVGMIERFEGSPPDFVPLYTAIGRSITKTKSLPNKFELLNRLWAPISKVGPEHIKLYIEALGVFTEFVIKFFSPNEVNILLSDAIKHIREARSPVNHEHLKSVMSTIIRASPDINSLLSLSSLLPFLDLFSLDVKTHICQQIIDVCSRKEMKSASIDAVFIQSFFAVTRVIHDSIEMSRHSTEFITRTSEMLCRIIQSLNFGRNVEQHLNLLTEARASFNSLELVMKQLTFSALGLAMKTHGIVKGKHNIRTHSFVKACVSYAHITVPSIEDTYEQALLYYSTAQVSLVNGLVGECENLVKILISLIPELAREDKLLKADELFKSLVGLMVLLPENPANEDKFLLPATGLLNTLMTLTGKYAPLKFQLLNCMLPYLCSQLQDRLPVSIFRLDSNDRLMAGNVRFTSEVKEMIVTVITELLEQVSVLAEHKQSDSGSLHQFSLTALNCAVIYDLDETPEALTVVKRLLEILKGKNPALPAVLGLTQLLA